MQQNKIRKNVRRFDCFQKRFAKVLKGRLPSSNTFLELISTFCDEKYQWAKMILLAPPRYSCGSLFHFTEKLTSCLLIKAYRCQFHWSKSLNKQKI